MIDKEAQHMKCEEREQDYADWQRHNLPASLQKFEAFYAGYDAAYERLVERLRNRRKSFYDAPARLNSNDKAMWVTGWNECLESIAKKQSKLMNATIFKAYYPIVLSFNNKENSRQWSLTFKLTPVPEIIFSGVEPTTDELIEVLKGMPSTPIWFIDICKVCIGDCIEREKAK